MLQSFFLRGHVPQRGRGPGGQHSRRCRGQRQGLSIRFSHFPSRPVPRMALLPLLPSSLDWETPNPSSTRVVRAVASALQVQELDHVTTSVTLGATTQEGHRMCLEGIGQTLVPTRCLFLSRVLVSFFQETPCLCQTWCVLRRLRSSPGTVVGEGGSSESSPTQPTLETSLWPGWLGLSLALLGKDLALSLGFSPRCDSDEPRE